MLDIRLADELDWNYFIDDYLNRYGEDDDLAKKHAMACINLHRSIILHNDSEVIGSVTWAIREGIQAGLVVIFQMSISKEINRGKGYGSIMVKACINDIENFYTTKGQQLRRIFIGISENNLAGRNIYKKQGFRVLTELKDHLRTGEKELIYCRDYF